jgi:hypothetical protein
MEEPRQALKAGQAVGSRNAGMANKRKLRGALEYEIGGGNVYKDLGFKDADAMLMRRASLWRSHGSSAHDG